MKTTDDTLAFALRQTWLATAAQPDTDDPGTDLLRHLLLTNPGTDSRPTTAELRVHQRLSKRLTTNTLGQLLTQATAALTPAQQTEQTGFAPQTLDDLRANKLHPTAVPVMRMKRLVGFLNLQLDEVRAVLQKTADLYREQLVPTQYGFALTGRMANPETGSAMHGGSGAGGRSLFESDEALQLYLNRLAEELTTDTGRDTH